MSAVVFDIGGVLVRWDPRLAFADRLGGLEAAAAFLDRIGFAGLNLRADGGESFADLAREIGDPADRETFLGYLPNYARTVPEAIEESWALIDRLRRRGLAVHAITNWSAETWPAGVAAHPRLGTAFGVTVVSGRERMLKPEARIFALLCQRAGVAAGDCLFIDDGAANVAGARAAGMDAVHFTGAGALAEALTDRGLL